MKRKFILLIFLCSIVNATTINYQGEETLCITNSTGNRTCLNQHDNYSYDDSKEYLLELENKHIDRNASEVSNFFLSGVDMVFALMIFFIVILIAWKLFK